MLTKSILTAAALALVAGLGSASAGQQFTTIADLSPQALSADELAEIRGAGVLLISNSPLGVVATIHMSDAVAIRICGEIVCTISMGRPVPAP